MQRWRGKVVVVTGASSGIGAAISLELLKSGMIVVGLARRVERIEALQNQIPCTGYGKLHAIQCDVTNDADVRQAFRWIFDQLGVVHVLVNNAGISRLTNITDEGNEDELKSVMQTNLWGTVFCTKQAVEIMKRQQVTGAHIININSSTGHRVHETGGDRAYFNLYPSTKFGVTALTAVLDQEFSADGLGYKITSISPGTVSTDFVDPRAYDHLHMQWPSLNPVDVANAVLFALATPKHVQISELKIKPVGEMF